MKLISREDYRAPSSIVRSGLLTEENDVMSFAAFKLPSRVQSNEHNTSQFLAGYNLYVSGKV